VVAGILRGLPSRLNAYCAGVCGAITPDYGREVVSLANALAVRPLQGRVVQLDGSRRSKQLDAVRFLELVVETDLNPSLAAEMPAAVHAAREGNAVPLLRLAQLVQESAGGESLATAVYVATSCDDGPFPWRPDTPLAERPALLKAALAKLPTRSFGGFGRWAAGIGNAALCLRWPVSPARPPQPAVGYPDIPVLAIGGALDLRSPTSEARPLVAHFRHGELVTVTNAGHAPLASAPSTCLLTAVQKWVSGRGAPSSCPSKRLLAPLEPFPRAGGQSPATAALKLTLVGQTVREAADTWLLTRYEGSTRPAPGLEGGRVKDSGSGFSLSGYSLVRGLSLDGAVEIGSSQGLTHLELHGIVRVKSGRATIGTLTVNGNALDGDFDGRIVRDGRFAAEVPGVATAGEGWSAWTPPTGTAAEVATAVARQVADEYKLDQAGTPLLNVSTGPPTAPGTNKRLAAVAVRTSPYGGSIRKVEFTRDTWTYTLCGTATFCSLPGAASATRGRLVRREALELALYTFMYAPTISSLLVYVPPAPGAPPSSVLYFQRSRLAAELARPLDKTLTLASPPLPTDTDVSETGTIDSLTLPYLYTYEVTTLAGGTILKLKPSY
jgi:hypothetical protein